MDALSATNPFLIVAISDFNVKANNLYTGDTPTFEDSKIEPITSQFELQQIINELTNTDNLRPLLILSSPLNQIW